MVGDIEDNNTISGVLREHTVTVYSNVSIGSFVSLAEEVLQLVTRLDIFDLDDLMNNVIGTLLGWACYRRWIRET